MYFNILNLVTPLCSPCSPVRSQHLKYVCLTLRAVYARCESSRISISVGPPSRDERISFEIPHDLGKVVPTSE